MAFILSVRDWRSSFSVDVFASPLVVIFLLAYVSVLETPVPTLGICRIGAFQRFKAGGAQSAIRSCFSARRFLLLLFPQCVGTASDHNNAGCSYQTF
ncbi:hypothetical protein JS562_41465 [Agrobacterium sp. S2]|nr:hypothetical protein [Agrobacterium sp. S2]